MNTSKDYSQKQMLFRDTIVEEETFRILSEAIEKLPTK